MTSRAPSLWLKAVLGGAISLGFLYWVNQRLDWQPLLAAWRSFPPWLLAACLLLVFSGYLLRARRFHLLSSRQTGGRFHHYLAINIWHTAAINWLPMRLGEALYPWLMHHFFRHSPLEAGGTLLWLRLLDLFALLWLAGLGWAWLQAPAWLPVLALSLLLLPLGWWLQQGLRGCLATRDSAQSRWPGWLEKVLDGFPRQNRDYWHLAGLTWAAWAVKLMAFVLAASHFSSLSVGQLLPGILLAELASSLPIQGLAGFGTYEAAMVLGLSWGGNSVPAGPVMNTLLAAAINLHLFILASSLLFALLALPFASAMKQQRHQP